MKPGEEETVAELTVVPAGLAYGITSWIVSFKLANVLLSGNFAAMWPNMPDLLMKVGEWYVKEVPALYGLKRVAATLAIMYWTTWVVFKWHSLLITGESIFPLPLKEISEPDRCIGRIAGNYRQCVTPNSIHITCQSYRLLSL